MTACEELITPEVLPGDDPPIDEEPCGEPAVVLMRLSCVHEHVTEWKACAGCCVDEQMTWPPDGPLCLACGIGTQAHDCPVRASIEALP